jgi:DNA-binding transcriptional LysR family regulator
MIHADLNSLIVFSRIIDAGSFSEAARRLGMPVSSVSRRIADLENQLGIRLLERSTRSLRLTNIGMEILAHARRSVEVGEAIVGIVSNQRSEVSGTLSISAPPSLSDWFLIPIVAAFQGSNPQVRVQLLITDRTIDHIVEGVDLAFQVGPLKDSSLVVRELLTFRHQLVASPAYLKHGPALERPRDLLMINHRVIAFSHRRNEVQWQLCHVNGRDRELLTFEPHIQINDFAGLAAALLAGLGVGDLPPFGRPDLLRDGRLIEVMPEWQLPLSDLSLLHLGNRHISPAIRAFKELARRMAPSLLPGLPIEEATASRFV